MTLTICQNADDLAARAAQLIVEAAQDAVQARDRFTIALAGGSTPEKTYALLAQPANAGQIAWIRTQVFFGDERLVSPDDPNSNYGMARRTLLSKVLLPDDNVYPIGTEGRTADEAARAYVETLAGAFEDADRHHPPQFDLILLGLGDDGHTASLFPGAASLARDDVWVVGSPPGTLPPPVDRVTLTFPMLNAARQVIFLVAGQNKAEAVRDVLEGHAAKTQRPAAGVQPTDGALTWLVDKAAASLLADVS